MSSYTQYSQYGGNPYNNGPDPEAGQGAQGSHLGQPPIEHEMTNLSATSNYSNNATSVIGGLSQEIFLQRVSHTGNQIAELANSIAEIENLHKRALSSVDASSSSHLEAVVSRTQAKITEIRDSIKHLEGDASKFPSQIKTTQVKQLRNEFNVVLTNYQREERNYNNQYRGQIERQYRIVYPDATTQDVEQALEMNWADEGVFRTALKSSRSTQAQSVFGAVRARHNELAQIEKTLTQLAAVFADMAQIVEAQEPNVQRTEDNAIKTAEDVRRGKAEIEIANEHTRRRNRLKWWCLLVVVLIILAIALGVGLGVGLANKAVKT